MQALVGIEETTRGELRDKSPSSKSMGSLG